MCEEGGNNKRNVTSRIIRLLSNHGSWQSPLVSPELKGPSRLFSSLLIFCVTFHHPDVTTTQPPRRRWNECCRFIPPPSLKLACLRMSVVHLNHPSLQKKMEKKKQRKEKEMSPLLSREQKRTTVSVTFVACFYFILVGVIFF